MRSGRCGVRDHQGLVAPGPECEDFRLRNFSHQPQTRTARAQSANRSADNNRFAASPVVQSQPGVEGPGQQWRQDAFRHEWGIGAGARGMTPTRRQPSVRRRSPISKKPATITAIPERGLKIGEAARALGVETYVLRFWETQFPFLKPKHTRTKHRFYHDHDLEVLRLIKRLLHQEGFTIAGANKYIRENGLETLLAGKATTVVRPEPVPSAVETSQKSAVDGHTRRVLSDVRRDLESLHKMLE